METNNTQEVKKTGLTLGQKVFIGFFSAYIGYGGYMLYQNPLIYLRPCAEQTATRTVNGVDILRKEHRRFDRSIIDGTRINVTYKEESSGQPDLTLFVSESFSSDNWYNDKNNDGKVDIVSIKGNILYREENKELFENTIDPKLAAYKQRFNADEVIAEKMKETPPTIEDLLGK